MLKVCHTHAHTSISRRLAGIKVVNLTIIELLIIILRKEHRLKRHRVFDIHRHYFQFYTQAFNY
jgi:hypothetical protein